MGARLEGKGRKMLPCYDCGGPRTECIMGERNGKHVPVCADCMKQTSLQRPLFQTELEHGVTAFVDILGHKRFYRRKRPKHPGIKERRLQIRNGLKWCKECESWLPLGEVSRGLCQAHLREWNRQFYASVWKMHKKRPARKHPDRPGRMERAEQLAKGLKWCRRCTEWLLAGTIRSGLCKAHRNQEYREHYANGGRVAIAERIHARARNLTPMPVIACELLIEQFEGRCAYCQEKADTWDHIVPVVLGGQTEPGNIVPACHSCNSSKRSRLLDEFLEHRPNHSVLIFDVISLQNEVL